MATERLLMRQIREILRLRWAGGLPQRAVARACGVGLGTVSEFARRPRYRFSSRRNSSRFTSASRIRCRSRPGLSVWWSGIVSGFLEESVPWRSRIWLPRCRTTV
jgi:hypothetical protein